MTSLEIACIVRLVIHIQFVFNQLDFVWYKIVWEEFGVKQCLSTWKGKHNYFIHFHLVSYLKLWPIRILIGFYIKIKHFGCWPLLVLSNLWNGKSYNTSVGTLQTGIFWGWLIDWCLMPISAVFQLYRGIIFSDFCRKTTYK